jgi:hypothetical protein
MPHLFGEETADRTQSACTHTKIPFTSAFGETAIVQHGLLDTGVALLQIPFTPSARAHKSQEMLHQPFASKPDDAQETFGFAKIYDRG